MSEMDREIVAEALILAAERAAANGRAAGFARVFGSHSEAYFGLAEQLRQLASDAREGKEIKDNNGLKWPQVRLKKFGSLDRPKGGRKLVSSSAQSSISETKP